MIKVMRSAVIDAPIDDVWAVLRDFNSHHAWHPAVGESNIENNEPADQVGCVRNFYLKDGNQIREQLLTLSDADYVSTYCIVDATLPMRRYVATVQLRPVTDGARTFWHWESSFDVPPGREREFERLVGDGVYQAGFDGLRAYLRGRGRELRQSDERIAQIKAPAAAAVAGHGIVVTRHGSAAVLDYRSISAPAPGPNEVRIEQRAIGVNFIDVYVREGWYRMIEPPAVLGMEAAGVITDVGPAVTKFLPGDRVAYACAPPGAYCTVRTMAADQLVLLPDDVDFEAAAALMLKGLSAEYLLYRTHRVRAGEHVLVHAAAGGVGLLLCRWARALGAHVLGTVSSNDKARLARENGCEVPIVTTNYRFADQVLAATGGAGADVIYDGLGRAAFDENLRAIAPIGHWVSFGQASGAHESIQTDALSSKSITLTRPVLFHFTAQRAVLDQMAERLFTALRTGTVRVDIKHRYPLAAAALAHQDLEQRKTTGQIILIP